MREAEGFPQRFVEDRDAVGLAGGSRDQPDGRHREHHPSIEERQLFLKPVGGRSNAAAEGGGHPEEIRFGSGRGGQAAVRQEQSQQRAGCWSSRSPDREWDSA